MCCMHFARKKHMKWRVCMNIFAAIRNIGFPELGIDPMKIDNVAFNVFGKDVYWYGVIIAVGFILALAFAAYRFKKEGMKTDDLLDIALFSVPIGIIGARLYYVVFNHTQFSSFYEVIAIWDGGLAIYGGVIFGVITALLVCRFKKLSIGKVFDILCISLMIGQAVGRWGNFVNGEAFGAITQLPWGMTINGTGPWHPTFFYESLWNVLGIVLLLLWGKYLKKQNGEIFWGYMAWYGLGRAFIEYLRTDSLMIGDFKVSLILGAVFFLAGALRIVWLRTKMPPEEALADGEIPVQEAKESEIAEAAEEHTETEEQVAAEEAVTVEAVTEETETKEE